MDNDVQVGSSRRHSPQPRRGKYVTMFAGTRMNANSANQYSVAGTKSSVRNSTSSTPVVVRRSF
eukprot:5159851-Pleurochrysis_carterae.AAC.4